MKKKLLKRGGAFLTAVLLGFSSLTLYAAEPSEDQKQEAALEQGRPTEEAEVRSEDQQTADQTEQSQSESGTETQDAKNTTDGQYDVTKPVIEKVEFAQNGQTLTQEDTVQFFVYAYDAESGIDHVSASVLLEAEGETGHTYSMNFTYDEDNDRYVGEYSLANVRATKGSIINIRAVDPNGNYASWQYMDNTTGRYLYTFEIAPAETPAIRVTDFQMDENGQTLKVGDQIHLTMKIEPDYTGDGYIELSFKSEDSMSEVTNTMYSLGDGNYTCGWYVGDYMAGTRWALQNIRINVGGQYIPLEMDGQADYWFEVEGAEDTEKPVITSIEIDKNGEILKEGDSAIIRVKAEDNMGLNPSSAYAYMQAAVDIDIAYQYVPLTYNDVTGVFEGTFDITEDTYPCEWYMQSVSVADQQGNVADVKQFDPDFYNTYPYYVNVTKGTTFINPSFDVNISFRVLDESGYWKDVLTVNKQKIERRTTFAEAGIEIPEMADTYPGLTQTGWQTSMGQAVDENTQILQNIGYMAVYAVYDKMPVHFSYTYLNEDGQTMYKESEQPVLFEQGTTYGDALEYMSENFTPAGEYPGTVFQGWEFDGNYAPDTVLNNEMYLSAHAVYDKGVLNATYSYLNDQNEWSYAYAPVLFEKGITYGEVLERAKEYIPDDAAEGMPIKAWTYYNSGALDQPAANFGYMSFTADYGDKCVVMSGRIYYDEEGYQITERTPYTVDKGTKVSELYEKVEAMDMPRMYEGLKFDSWDPAADPDTEITESGAYYFLRAAYTNCMIRMAIMDSSVGDMVTEDFAHLYCVVAEKGQTITLPSSFEGFENVVWDYYPEGGTLTVQGDVTIYGYPPAGTTWPEQPEDPTPEEPEDPTPEEPEDPSPEQPQEPAQPGQDGGTELPDSAVSGVVETINNAQPGADVRVDMGNATVVSKEILEAARGKDVDVQLNMNGYTWTINGQDIAASNLESINLAVNVNANAIPNKVVQALAGDNPTRQLSLAHEGNFGFKAVLTISVGSEYAGKYGNLFYYDSDGKMVYMDAGTVTPEGMLSLAFSHASDYVIVFSDAQMSQSDVPADLQPLYGGNQKNIGVARTGDASQIVVVTVVMLVALAAMGTVVMARRRDHSK